MKKDGHTHTEFCPHGSFEPVEKMIQQAIKLGFKEYAITEHAPLPPDFAEVYAGEPQGLQTASMSFNDLPLYFTTMEGLQQKYASDLNIKIGFEMDYLPLFENWTKDFLTEYGPRTQDGILSVHFQAGQGGWWCLDYTPEEFETGLVSHYQDFPTIYQEYFNLIHQSLTADLGPFKPQRLGHMTLIQKFEQFFPQDTAFSQTNRQYLKELLAEIAQKKYQLDFNTAGLDKPFYQQTYPSADILKEAQALGIPFVFGSDAHSIAEVGRHYQRFSNI
ncbi:histidinol-phosphatase HisJ [Vagococcus sp. BWB3-3]|uniref:Histidinol-phosphatase n=1 Tax=Vagococcus allomyrinae TaxID=2794353 RepID=A0A940PIR7_9ENTE|nr:histidinol-phosphatase HisJ [Vagococcus allomyrinae]MBP1044331.1 histidinol-phosphatase HisJ [Vagococcus allomyrinae]